MGPKRRVTATDYNSFPKLNAVGKVDLMRRRNNAALSQNKGLIDRIHDNWIRDRIDLVHPKYLAISANADVGASANNIQIPDPYPFTNCQPLSSEKQIQVTDSCAISNVTIPDRNDREPDSDPFSDTISK
jgi:hypothetical protein